jgi:membrane protein DedA with SNARE-associated domain
MEYTKIRKFGRSGLSYIIAFLWGICEGVFFFIVPDVYIGFVAIFSGEGGLVALLSALAGSLVSIFIIYALNAVVGGHLIAWLLMVPGIHGPMIVGVSNALQRHGAMAVILGPWSGIPLKIYSVLAAQLSIPIGEYFLWSIVARIERTVLVLAIGMILGRIFKSKIQKHPRIAIGIYVALWVFIYVLYFSAVSL